MVLLGNLIAVWLIVAFCFNFFFFFQLAEDIYEYHTAEAEYKEFCREDFLETLRYIGQIMVWPLTVLYYAYKGTRIAVSSIHEMIVGYKA